MSEIYWITVLGNLEIVVTFLLYVVLLVTFGVGIGCCIETFGCEDEDKGKKLGKMTLVGSLVSLILGLFVCFIPSKQDLYLIYGAGTIIDYCQDNPKVKEIPDKAIDALNTWLDMVNKKREDNYVDCER